MKNLEDRDAPRATAGNKSVTPFPAKPAHIKATIATKSNKSSTGKSNKEENNKNRSDDDEEDDNNSDDDEEKNSVYGVIRERVTKAIQKQHDKNEKEKKDMVALYKDMCSIAKKFDSMKDSARGTDVVEKFDMFEKVALNDAHKRSLEDLNKSATMVDNMKKHVKDIFSFTLNGMAFKTSTNNTKVRSSRVNVNGCPLLLSSLLIFFYLPHMISLLHRKPDATTSLLMNCPSKSRRRLLLVVTWRSRRITKSHWRPAPSSVQL